jgi:hypothetical protein
MTRYLSCAETAKLIRAQLKAKFPGIKFSVKSSVYAGGASIDVAWVDGPTGKMVDAIVKPFEGRGFDGMIDLAYSKTAYLMPDGSACFAQSEGTADSGGVYPADKAFKPVAEAERVQFGSNYVFTTRKYTPAFMERAVASFERKYGEQGITVTVSDYDGSAHVAMPASADYWMQSRWAEAIGKRVDVKVAKIAAA